MSRGRRIAIGIPVAIGLYLGIGILIPRPVSFIIASIVVVLVLDWMWNRRLSISKS